MNLSFRAWCATVALVVVAGCGGGGSDSDGPATTTTAPSSAAPTTSAPVASDAGTRPKDDRSDAGAIAFSKFAIDRIVSVTTGADVDEVLSIASADCKGCINLAQEMKKNGTVTQEFDAEHQIEDAKVIDTSDDGNQYLVEQILVSSPGRKVDTATGETVETFDTATRLSVRVLMTWTDDKWILSNYSSQKAS